MQCLGTPLILPIALPLSPSFSAALPSHGLVSHALSANFLRQLNAHNLNAAWKLGYGINAGFLASVILMNQSRFLSSHYESALDHALRKSIIFTMCAYRSSTASFSFRPVCLESEGMPAALLGRQRTPLHEGEDIRGPRGGLRPQPGEKLCGHETQARVRVCASVEQPVTASRTLIKFGGRGDRFGDGLCVDAINEHQHIVYLTYHLYCKFTNHLCSTSIHVSLVCVVVVSSALLPNQYSQVDANEITMMLGG